MPLAEGLHEIRSDLLGGRIARVFFYISRAGHMTLLHGMVKKTPKTPDADLKLARRNKRLHERKA